MVLHTTWKLISYQNGYQNNININGGKIDWNSILEGPEYQTVTTGLEKVSFHSNPRERQCQRILKLPHNCTHLTC